MSTEDSSETPDEGATSGKVSEDASNESSTTSEEQSQSIRVSDETPSSDTTPAPRAKDAKPTGFIWLTRSLLQASMLACVGIGLIALVGVAQRTGWIVSESARTEEQHDHGGEAVYTCPMHPQIRMNQPGKCPICRMKLVLVSQPNKSTTTKTAGDDRYICPMMCTPASSEQGRCPVCAMDLVPATSGSGPGNSVSVDPVARRLVGIRTAVAELKSVDQTIRTIGRLQYDESRLATISAYVDGRLEKMYADYVGVPVSEDDDLALLYSPQLYSAQIEFLTTMDGGALSRLAGDGNRMRELAKQNLIELGMTDEQTDALQQSGKAQSRSRIRSPITGTVIEKSKVEGDYVKMGEMIYRVADLSTVWLMLDLFPDDAARIRFGQKVEAEIESMPGLSFDGRVAFISPTVDTITRTVSVRVETLNRDGKLRPGDFATARIAAPAIPQSVVYDPALAGKFISPMHPQIILDAAGDCPVCGMDLIPTTELGYATKPVPDQKVVTVPRQAVLMAGSNSVVYVETELGFFVTRRVVIGPLTDTHAIIAEGISAGEVVATDGNFLIDSQMQLAGNPSLLDPSRASLYPPGPLPLPKIDAVILSNDAAKHFDQAYEAYFSIQQALAADRVPPTAALTKLDNHLAALLSVSKVLESAQTQLNVARRAVSRMQGPIESARKGFRVVSHAMLKVAAMVRGNSTAAELIHFHCPMVPGGGGDWMQPSGRLVNPYYGSEMLHCGEQVADMKIKPHNPSKE